jgi:hypothetical protein
MMEKLSSSETSVLTRATWRNILEDTILHSHRRENLKSYKDFRNLPHFNSIQFNTLLFMCRVNGHKANINSKITLVIRPLLLSYISFVSSLLTVLTDHPSVLPHVT